MVPDETLYLSYTNWVNIVRLFSYRKDSGLFRLQGLCKSIVQDVSTIVFVSVKRGKIESRLEHPSL